MATDAIKSHNESVLNYLEAGDLVEFKRGIYSHWAVYVGEKRVVHLAGTENDGLNDNVNSGHIFTICGLEFNKAVVKTDNFWDVTLDSRADKNNGKDRKLTPDTKAKIVDRAFSKLGEIGYNVLWKNCEHFASWCRYGLEWSEQVINAAKWGFGAGIGTGIIGIGTFLAFRKQKDKRRAIEIRKTHHKL